MIRPWQSIVLRLVLVAAAGGTLAPLALTVTSCSIIGLALGNAIGGNPPPRRVRAGQALAIDPGTRLAVYSGDSLVARGRYLGRMRFTPEEYAPRYARWREHSGVALELGDEIEVEPRSGRSRRGRFAGFGYRSLLLEEAADRAPAEIRLNRLLRVSRAGVGIWSGPQLERMDSTAALPGRDGIRIQPEHWRTESGRDELNGRVPRNALDPGQAPITVPLEEVGTVLLRGPRVVQNVFVLAGITADVLIVVGVVAVTSMDSGCSGGGFTLAANAPGVHLTTRDFDTWRGEFVDPTRSSGDDAGPDVALEDAPMPTSPQGGATVRVAPEATLPVR